MGISPHESESSRQSSKNAVAQDIQKRERLAIAYIFRR